MGAAVGGRVVATIGGRTQWWVDATTLPSFHRRMGAWCYFLSFPSASSRGLSFGLLA